MSKSSQQYYDHSREFGNVEVAEQMYLIELAENNYKPINKLKPEL